MIYRPYLPLMAGVVYASSVQFTDATKTSLLRKNGDFIESNDPADYMKSRADDVFGDPVEDIMLNMELDWGLREMERYRLAKGFYPIKRTAELADGGSSQSSQTTTKPKDGTFYPPLRGLVDPLHREGSSGSSSSSEGSTKLKRDFAVFTG